MRVLLRAALAALAMSAASVGAAQAQNNCPVTETRSTGPNGETIIRREACGAVEITTVGGNSSTTSSTTSSTRNRTTTNTPPPTNQPSTPPPANTGAPNSTSSVMTIPGRNVGSSGSPPPMPQGNMGGGWNPAAVPDPMSMQRPVARIVLYDNNNFRGRNIGITQNTPDLGRRRFSDLASAARSQGGVWELCTEPNYGGTCVTTDTDLVLGAAGVDNTIASVRLIRP